MKQITLALNCLLIVSSDFVALIDTGFGTKGRPSPPDSWKGPARGIVGPLADWGVSPESVDLVINTHLHHDHAGGNTNLQSTGLVLAAFPRARYVIQRQEWLAAAGSDPLALYEANDMLPLESGRIDLVDGEITPAPGIHCVLAPGHTPGHQYVVVERGADHRPIYFLGDIAPLVGHIETPSRLSAIDFDIPAALATKKRVLREAADRDAIIVLSHDERIGRAEGRGDEFLFRDCDPAELS